MPIATCATGRSQTKGVDVAEGAASCGWAAFIKRAALALGRPKCRSMQHPDDNGTATNVVAAGPGFNQFFGKRPILGCCRHTFRGLGQSLGEIGLFPGELRLAATEVAAGGRFAVDRPSQVEVLDDSRRGEREVLLSPIRRSRASSILAGSLGVDVDAHRFGNADRVGELHFAAVRQSGGDDVLGHVAGHVGGAAVDLGGILAAEGTAAVAAPAAVGVDDDLATGQPTVAVGATDDEPSGGIDMVSDVAVCPARPAIPA